jgi:hypothetical protein
MLRPSFLKAAARPDLGQQMCLGISRLREDSGYQPAQAPKEPGTSARRPSVFPGEGELVPADLAHPQPGKVRVLQCPLRQVQRGRSSAIQGACTSTILRVA